jgi:hypothetical protein
VRVRYAADLRDGHCVRIIRPATTTDRVLVIHTCDLCPTPVTFTLDVHDGQVDREHGRLAIAAHYRQHEET